MRNPAKLTLADTELGQTRERGSARPYDVDRALDAPDELTDQLIVREPAIGKTQSAPACR